MAGTEVRQAIYMSISPSFPVGIIEKPLPPSIAAFFSFPSFSRHRAFNSYFLDSVSNGWYLPLPSFALSRRRRNARSPLYDGGGGDNDDDIPEFVAALRGEGGKR